MSEFLRYRKKGMTEMRPYVVGEPLDGISVQPDYLPSDGDMVARNPNDHKDQWLISKQFFEKNYEEA